MSYDTPQPGQSDPARAIRELAHADAARSLSARIRELLSDIEAVHDAGVTHARIVERLNEAGLLLSLATYQKLLHRARKDEERKRAGSASPPSAVASPPSALHPLPPSVEGIRRQPDPVLLRRSLTNAPPGYEPDD